MNKEVSEPKKLTRLTVTENKIEKLLEKEKIYKVDLEGLFAHDEIETWQIAIATKITTLKDVELDKFLEKIKDVSPKGFKNQLYERNHVVITQSIFNSLKKFGTVPSKNNIAHDTGLSRQTVSKHLKSFDKHPHYHQEIQKYKMMASVVTAKIFEYAIAGDMKASKLFLQLSGYVSTHSADEGKSIVNTQNNYVQINDLKITQENISHLSPNQLRQLESLIKSANKNSH